MLKRPAYFDVKEHLRLLHRHVFPLFFALCGIVMVIIIVVQAGKQGGDLPPADFVGARIGLIQSVKGAALDPALAVLTPSELVLAPRAPVFDSSGSESVIFRSEQGGIVVSAVADGRVGFAGMGKEGASVLLIHEVAGKPVETLYRDLASIRVSVGSQVRRGQALGTAIRATASSATVTSRSFPGLASDPVAGEVMGIPEVWRGRKEDRISRPPVGDPIEPSALKFEAPVSPKDPDS